MAKAVEHIKDGREVWKIGLLGFFTRLRGLYFSAALSIIPSIVLLTEKPFWVDYLKLTQVPNHGVFFFLALFFALLTIVFIIVRKNTFKSLEIKSTLHSVVHNIRDSQTKLHRLFLDVNKLDVEAQKSQMISMLNDVAGHAAEFFKFLTSDNTVCCAIRISTIEEGADAKKTLLYKTYARSKGFNQHRSSNSEGIPNDKGIPKYLSNEAFRGVLFIHDIDEAAKTHIYHKTQNDIDYPEDVKFMMVAPLNAWASESQQMIGMLHITSRKKRFSLKHTASVAQIADVTALAISNAMQILASSK